MNEASPRIWTATGIPRLAEFTYPAVIPLIARSPGPRRKSRPPAAWPSTETTRVPTAKASIEVFAKEPSGALAIMTKSAAGMATWKTKRPSTDSACGPRMPLRATR